MSDDALAIPVGWDIDFTAIGTYVVVLGRNSWWLLVEVATPSEANIYVLWLTIAQHLPVAWHLDVVPFRVIKVSLVEIRRALICIGYPVELPCALKRQVVHTLLLVKILSTCSREVVRIVSEVHCVQRQTIDFIHLEVVPLCESWLLDGYRLYRRLNGSLRFSCTKGHHCQSCHTQCYEQSFIHYYYSFVFRYLSYSQAVRSIAPTPKFAWELASTVCPGMALSPIG